MNHPNQCTQDASNSFVQGTTTGKNIVAFTVMGYKVVKKIRVSILGQSREKFVYSWLEEAQVIGVRETTLREPVPDTGCPGEKTLRVELGLRLRNVQDIRMWSARQSSTSAKLFEGWDHLMQFLWTPTMKVPIEQREASNIAPMRKWL